MVTEAVEMGWAAFVIAVLVPAVILITRPSRFWQRVTLPPAAALPLFLLLHAAVTLGSCRYPPGPLLHRALDAVLIAGSFLFWLPVLGIRHRLSDPGRCMYLFLAAPLLDMPAVGMIALGDTFGGLTMIVAMLPIGIAAMVVTWRWVIDEERIQAAAPELSSESPTA
ncbi:hypothetical protein AB0M87_15070 [Streptomyces sp. NPDC051320]|uniref:hypothetical protein n=1 Tax=Streptomyces sp. NPDC051320 TaxID=3154644 RepID=UPI0034295350